MLVKNITPTTTLGKIHRTPSLLLFHWLKSPRVESPPIRAKCVEFEIASLLSKATITWTSVVSQWQLPFIANRYNRPIGDSEAWSFSCWRRWLTENCSGARNWQREREGGNLERVKGLQQNNRNHIGYIFHRLAMAIKTEKWDRAFSDMVVDCSLI